MPIDHLNEATLLRGHEVAEGWQSGRLPVPGGIISLRRTRPDVDLSNLEARARGSPCATSADGMQKVW
jgi:hypothetical protein